MRKCTMMYGGAVIIAGLVIMGMTRCRTIPKGVTAVAPFETKKYLGKWYEIARLDFKFEKGLTNVTAAYSIKPDGSIKVINRGYDPKESKWDESVGKAKFVDSENEGKLKVSFFGPFYSGYNVIAIDPEYKYALVCGKNHDYLWILSREKEIPKDVRDAYLAKAESLGYETTNLVWTQHSPNVPDQDELIVNE